MVVAGTEQAVLMVESEAKELNEDLNAWSSLIWLIKKCKLLSMHVKS